MKPSVLIVDNEEVICEGLSRLLSDDYTTYSALNGREAINIVKEKSDIEIMLCDIKMPEMEGDEMIEKIRSENKDITMIIISAAPPQRICEAMRKGANNFLIKPLNIPLLEMTLKNTIMKKTGRKNISCY
jgi:YesN/AraC family two-component response regulator